MLSLVLRNVRNGLNSIVGNMHKTFLRRNMNRSVSENKNAINGRAILNVKVKLRDKRPWHVV